MQSCELHAEETPEEVRGILYSRRGWAEGEVFVLGIRGK